MSQGKLHSDWPADVCSSAWQVSLSWSQREVEPGDDVTLRVEVAESASLVGVLVVDEATKWAGSHNDITMEAVRVTAVKISRWAEPPQSRSVTVGSLVSGLVPLWY